MSNIYTHWSDRPLVLNPNYKYRVGHREDSFKPSGLWFDVDGDWQRWCEAETFHLTSLAYKNVINVNTENYLVLTSAEDIDTFTAGYVKDGHRADWKRVREEYKGIIIAPYCWERRMTQHTFWYYTWDCASGCTWDLSTVKVTDVYQVPVKEEKQWQD